MYGLYAPFFVLLSSGVCKGNPPMTAHAGLLFMSDLLMESDATNYFLIRSKVQEVQISITCGRL